MLAYVAAAVTFLTIDFIWLTQIAGGFYRARLDGLLLDNPKVGVAAAFYCIYVIGIVIFAVVPAMRTGLITTALLYGALFGFFAYATYDLTNYATLKNWSATVSIVDIIWGTILTSGSAVAGYLATRFISG